MATKKISKKSKRRLALFGPVSLIIITFFFINLVTYIVRIRDLSREEKELQQKLLNLELAEKNLHTEITKLKDPDYIAKYARENYYYSKNGEYVIKIETKDSDLSLDEDIKDYSDYIMYGGIFVLFLLIVFIFRKKKK